MKTLLITPPFITPNSPYPATQILTGYLIKKKINVTQYDLSIAALNHIFSTSGLKKIFTQKFVRSSGDNLSSSIYKSRDNYIRNIELVMKFLNRRETGLSGILSEKNVFPMLTATGIADEFLTNDIWYGAFERGVYIASIFLNDIVYYIQKNIDPLFQLNKYAEKLGIFPSFSRIEKNISLRSGLVEKIYLNLLDKKISEYSPSIIGFTIPFPGCFISALKCCAFIKKKKPQIITILGGGFCNTEFTELRETGLFKYIDYLVTGTDPKILYDSKTEKHLLFR